MTTNIFESLNAAMLKAIEIPITSMLEASRMMLQQWFYGKRNEENTRLPIFTKPTKQNLREQIKMGRSMKVCMILYTYIYYIYYACI